MINFTLTDLKYLVALADEQHFAKAAQKCFVSQPTLSIAIKKLEDNLGITIFERENHRVLITPAGEEVVSQARKIILEAYNLLDIVESNQNPYKQPLKIGAIFTIGPYIFPELIQKVIDEEPKLQLIVEESYTDGLISKLLNGELDAIILATETNHPELTQIELYDDKLAVICAKEHTLAKVSKINSADLDKETFLLLGLGNCFRDQVLKICPECNASANNGLGLITASSLETIKFMVAMNIGISILPELALKNLPKEVKIKPLPKPAPSRKLSLVYRKNFARIKILQKLQVLLQKQLSSS